MIEGSGHELKPEPNRASVPSTRRDHGRRIPVALVTGCVVVLAIMMLVPSVGASLARVTSKTLTAPYSGVPLDIKDIITTGCGTYVLTHGPKFDLTSGVARVQANATVTSAPSCRSPAIPNAAQVVLLFGFSTRNFTLSAGTHVIKAVWDLHWTVTLKASGAGGTPGNLTTGVVLEAYLEVYDVTIGGSLNSNDWMKTVNRTGDTSVHFNGNQQVTVALSQAFNATHVYEFLTAIECGVVVEVAQGANTGQASAGLNLATNGNGATLIAIKGV